MRTRKKLLPGEPGTKKWIKKYGKDLICVRYRYDSARKRKMKTIELIVEEAPWEKNLQKIPGNKIIHIRVDYEETYLRRLVTSAGGRWNKEKKVWELSYKNVIELGLRDRIIAE